MTVEDGGQACIECQHPYDRDRHDSCPSCNHTPLSDY